MGRSDAEVDTYAHNADLVDLQSREACYRNRTCAGLRTSHLPVGSDEENEEQRIDQDLSSVGTFQNGGAGHRRGPAWSEETWR